jgi:hypothetical protein
MYRKPSLVLFSFLVFAGCGFIPLRPSLIDATATKVIPQGESIVFGRVHVVDRGKFVDHWYPHVTGYFRLYLLRDSSTQFLAYNLSGDGSFYWHLPPGHYTLTSFVWHDSLTHLTRPVLAVFEFAEGDSAIYIGTLTVTFTESRHFSHRLPAGQPSLEIKDDYGEAIQRFRVDRSTRGLAAKNLMHLEYAP